MVLYLSVAQTLELHALQIRRFGGSGGVRDRGAVESATARPRMTFGGEDLYPEIADKAAALMHSLVANHPFIDGNKRVGAHAGVMFLVVNEVVPQFASEELTEITLTVARGELSAEELAIWIRQRSRRAEL